MSRPGWIARKSVACLLGKGGVALDLETTSGSLSDITHADHVFMYQFAEWYDAERRRLGLDVEKKLVTIWLDDLRNPDSQTWREYLEGKSNITSGVVWVKNVDEFKAKILETVADPDAELHGVFFDNDLGVGVGQDGKHAFNWLEEQVHLNGWREIRHLGCQSANPSAKREIMSGIASLKRFWAKEIS